MKLKITLLLLCSVGFLLPVQAQEGSQYGLPKARDFNTWSIGARGGLNIFQGDLGPGKNNNSFLDQTDDYTYGLQVTKRISHTIGMRGRFMMGTFSGEGRVSRQTTNAMGQLINLRPEADFTSDMMEGTISAVYNFGNISFLKRSKRFHLELEAGLGFFSFDSELNIDDQRFVNETADLTEIMLPFGFGFKYQMGRTDLGLYYNYRKTLTDKVDVEANGLTEYDNYSQITVGINVTLGKKQDHLEWVNPMQIVYDDIVDMKDKMDLLSNDKDKDGVPDMFDKDNSTPEGAKVYGDGTLVDTDGDGVPDIYDEDPYTPRGAVVDEKGVEADSDGDGIPDSRDKEPNTAPGTLVNYQGVTIPKVDINEIRNMLGAGALALPAIYFDLESSTVKSTYEDRILMIAKLMKNYPSIKINIEGHADKSGSDAYNLKLAQRRADSVMKKLVEDYEVDATRLTSSTKGESEPATKSNNRMNRRVDFVIMQN